MPHTPEPVQPPAEVRLSTAHGYLFGAAVALVVALMLCLADYYTPVVITRGVFAVLAGLFVAGIVGYLVRSAEAQLARQIVGFAKQRYELGYDDGFVDGAGSPGRVEPINGRRVRP